MKKTNKTSLTAALFAAAIGLSPTESMGADYSPEDNLSPTVYGPPEYFSTMTEPVSTTAYNPEDEVDQPVYGAPVYTTVVTSTMQTQPVYGPPIFTTTTTTTQPDIVTETTALPQPEYGPPIYTTETTTQTDVTTETTIIPQPTYGPPLYFPIGDFNHDWEVDAFDLVRARQLIAEYDSDSFEMFEVSVSGDLNEDGKVNIADLVLLNKYILGNSSADEEPVEEPQDTTTIPPCTTVPVYGAPWALGDE